LDDRAKNLSQLEATRSAGFQPAGYEASSLVKRVAQLAGWKPAPLAAKDFRNRNRNLSGATFRRRLQLLLVFIK
jgi:hypothetical protein